MFPTFRPNGDLYFSSNGHVGMGGLDIYIAKVDAKTKKYKLFHPGYPLNSEADDFGMTICVESLTPIGRTWTRLWS